MRNSSFPRDAALGPLCLKLGSGITPRGGASVYVDSGTALIRSQNIYNADFAHDGLVFINDQTAEKMKGVSIESSDILLNITGDSVARCCQVPDDVLPARVNQHVSIVRPDQDELHPRYLMYFLVSPFMQAIMLSLAGSGGTRKALTKTMIERFRIPLPKLAKQRKITSILSAYDELIENNRRRIALLERAARELYREWFVRLRFPGREHTRIVDGVPEGWTTRALSEIADITMGQSPKSTYYNEDGNGLPFHQGVTNFGNRFPSHKTYCTMANRLAEPGDILFSVRAPVGRINITSDKIVIGRGLAAIRSNRNQQNLLFYALKNHFFREDMLGVGAIFAAITKKDLYGVDLLQAPDPVAEMFLDSVRPSDLQIERLHRMVGCLTEARDLLLPRLMSGEVAV